MSAIPPRAPSGARHCLIFAVGRAWAALACLAPLTSRAQDFPAWDPVVPAQLEGQRSAAFPDAPAEVLFWKVEIDDRNFRYERRTSDYIRYKIYDPARATDVTRISEINASIENIRLSTVNLRARLILPDGTIRDIGKESIHERPIQHRAAEDNLAQRLFGSEGLTVAEQFVAVDGLQSGAVLEFQILGTQTHLDRLARNLQKLNIPIRHVECVVRLYQGAEFNSAAFVVNPGGLHVDQSYDRGHGLCRVSADNLPPLTNEPFSPVVNGRSVTMFVFEDSTNLRTWHPANSVRVDSADGPWAPIAAKAGLLADDATKDPAALVARRAREVVDGAASETEKARRIHNFVHNLFVRFTRSPAGSREMVAQFNSAPLDRVLEFDQFLQTAINVRDFLWLEIAMDRAVGLNAQTVLLPDRQVMPFNVRLASGLFLPEYAARVQVDGAWRFSLANLAETIPFGWIPWRFQNGAALLAHDGKQEFATVPAIPAAASVITDTGTFTLAADGTLRGHARGRLIGEPALILRPRPRNASAARFKQTVAKRLSTEFPSADITVTAVSGLEDVDAPLEFEYDLNWPGYATATKTRLIFRPSVFHGQSPSPFAAADRKNAVEFPYHWREIDDVSLQLPAGYALESPSAPPGGSLGNALSYKVTVGPLPGANQIFARREFTSELGGAPASAYADLKRWYDAVAQSDAHELVLAKLKGAPVGAAASGGAETP